MVPAPKVVLGAANKVPGYDDAVLGLPNRPGFGYYPYPPKSDGDGDGLTPTLTLTCGLVVVVPD